MSSAVHAQAYKPVCVPTHLLPPANYPGAEAIPPGNNLVMPAGKSMEAEGQKLLLTGRVLDNHCMPIKDATIEIWQANPFGRYVLATRADLATPAPTFAGAGRGYTSNMGEFMFTTLFPSGVDKRAPFIGVRVKAHDMKPFTTQIFFANDGRNGADAVYSKLKGDEARSVTISMRPITGGNGFIGTIDIILPEKSKYVSY
ncbi:MAG: hypothetical protein ACOYJ2_08165 [Rickettsiales bacterium]